jgi:hypothetical protein
MSVGASEKLADYFEQNQEVPVSRNLVRQMAGQLDYMKRLRRNGGARDILDQKRIALLWGGGDQYLIAQLGLGVVSASEFISYAPKNSAELALIRTHGHPLQ